MKDCIIVGAGLAGLMAARRLTEAGWSVVVLDKGRGVGGRLATRRIENGTFDHGAQFFTVRDPRFRAFVDEWLAAGVVAEWARGFQESDGHPRYRGASGMTSIAKHLASGLNVMLSERVTSARVSDDGRWSVLVENGATFSGDALVMTPPVPQSLAIMGSLPDETRAALERITYNPCIAVMALLDRPSAVPAPGGVQINGEPLWWVGDNAQKGISAAPAVTIHAGPEFSRAHWDTDPDAVIALLLDAARDYIGGAGVITAQAHKWRYSHPATSHPDHCLLVAGPPPVVFAGDAFNGPRVEGSALSGLAAADALLT